MGCSFSTLGLCFPQDAEGDDLKDLFEDKLNRYFVTMKNKMINFKNVQVERLDMEGTFRTL